MRTQCISDLQCFETFRIAVSFGHSVYQIHSVLKLFEIAVSFANFGSTKPQLRWFAPCYVLGRLFKSSFPKLGTRSILHLQCFQTFRNCCLFCTFWLIRNFYSVDAHHAYYGLLLFCKFWVVRNFNSADSHHATYGERCSNHHSDIGHMVYITFIVFSNFSKLQFVLDILGCTKFLLCWCASC